MFGHAGIGNGLMYVTSSIVLHYHFDRMRTLANGVAVTGSGVGTLIFAFLVQSLLTHVKWRLTLVIEGAIMLIGIACAALYLPPPVSVDVDAIVDERQPLIADAARTYLFDAMDFMDFDFIQYRIYVQ
jgi:MFS family permease